MSSVFSQVRGQTIKGSTLIFCFYSSMFTTLQHLQNAVTLACKKRTSSWLSALSLQECGFALHNTTFLDALALHFGWLPSRIPSHCINESNFSIEHASSLPKVELLCNEHNKVHDLTAALLTDVCHDVKVQADLQPLNNEVFCHKTVNIQDGARLVI